MTQIRRQGRRYPVQDDDAQIGPKTVSEIDGEDGHDLKVLSRRCEDNRRTKPSASKPAALAANETGIRNGTDGDFRFLRRLSLGPVKDLAGCPTSRLGDLGAVNNSTIHHLLLYFSNWRAVNASNMNILLLARFYRVTLAIVTRIIRNRNSRRPDIPRTQYTLIEQSNSSAM